MNLPSFSFFFSWKLYIIACLTHSVYTYYKKTQKDTQRIKEKEKVSELFNSVTYKKIAEVYY